jgi:hypothetical protein
MNAEYAIEVNDIIADFIRESSRAEKLATEADIAVGIASRLLKTSGMEIRSSDFATFLQSALSTHDDIEQIRDHLGNILYFSERSMTRAFAGMLLLARLGTSGMMAEIIREQSLKYRRPVPCSLFQCSPFSLAREEIAASMNTMTNAPSFRDIRFLTASSGAVFAFSTTHLAPEQAALLAEWSDSGQVENP